MKFEFRTLYFAVESTPDYSEVLGFATSDKEARQILAKNNTHRGSVIEVDLDRILEKLLEEDE